VGLQGDRTLGLPTQPPINADSRVFQRWISFACCRTGLSSAIPRTPSWIGTLWARGSVRRQRRKQISGRQPVSPPRCATRVGPSKLRRRRCFCQRERQLPSIQRDRFRWTHRPALRWHQPLPVLRIVLPHPLGSAGSENRFTSSCTLSSILPGPSTPLSRLGHRTCHQTIGATTCDEPRQSGLGDVHQCWFRMGWRRCSKLTHWREKGRDNLRSVIGILALNGSPWQIRHVKPATGLGCGGCWSLSSAPASFPTTGRIYRGEGEEFVGGGRARTVNWLALQWRWSGGGQLTYLKPIGLVPWQPCGQCRLCGAGHCRGEASAASLQHSLEASGGWGFDPCSSTLVVSYNTAGIRCWKLAIGFRTIGPTGLFATGKLGYVDCLCDWSRSWESPG